MPRDLLIRPWTAEDDATLLDLCRRGKHPSAMAVRLRRTVAAVHTRKAVLMHQAANPAASDRTRGAERPERRSG